MPTMEQERSLFRVWLPYSDPLHLLFEEQGKALQDQPGQSGIERLCRSRGIAQISSRISNVEGEPVLGNGLPHSEFETDCPRVLGDVWRMHGIAWKSHETAWKICPGLVDFEVKARHG